MLLLLKIGGVLVLGWGTLMFGVLTLSSILAGSQEPAAFLATIPFLGLALLCGAFTIGISRI